MNFISVNDQYTKNYGKIWLSVNKFDIYLDSLMIQKKDLNIKISTMDIVEIISHIQKNNKYIIHIINTYYNSAPYNHTIDEISYLVYNKTIVIDNCGNIYIGCMINNEVKRITPSLYPMKVKSHKNVKVSYPEISKDTQLPNFLIQSIKKIESNFLFRTYDYTSEIISLLHSLTDVSYYISEFKEESNTNLELIREKDNIITNILDVELADFKEKNAQQIKTLNDIIDYLNNENAVMNNTLNETIDKNIKLKEKVIQKNEEYKLLNEDFNKIISIKDDFKNNYSYYLDEYNKTKLELSTYKNSKIIRFIRYILCIR